MLHYAIDSKLKGDQPDGRRRMRQHVKKDGSVIEPPFIKCSASGREIHRFFFQNIKLWEVPTDEIRQLGVVGLYPLLPLTREGASTEVVEEVVTHLEAEEEEETNMRAGGRFWLERRKEWHATAQ
jgi:hypothetical protein